MKTLYLASDLFFSSSVCRHVLPRVVETLQNLGAHVWEPYARNNQIDKKDPKWAYYVGQADVADVKNCDAVFAVINGTPPDEGVMIEMGLAMAWQKPIFLFRDDERNCTESGQYPLNLMLFVHLPATEWQDYYYTSLQDISNPNKALVQWLSGRLEQPALLPRPQRPAELQVGESIQASTPRGPDIMAP